MPEYNFTFDWNRITTIGKVKILAEQVVGAPTQAQIDEAIEKYIDEHPGSISGMTSAVKYALLEAFQGVTWKAENADELYDHLNDALFPPVGLISITAVYTQTGTVYDTDALDSLRNSLVVTANYSDGTSEEVNNYTLNGTLEVPTSTITATYGGLSDTFTVTVTHDTKTMLYNWDFTQSLTDTVQGQVAILAKVAGALPTQDAFGVHVVTSSGYVNLGEIYQPGITIEVDFGAMECKQENKNARLLMVGTQATGGLATGFIYRSTGVWGWYAGGSWATNTSETNANLFSNKTLKAVFDATGYMTVYADGALVGTSSRAFAESAGKHIQLGAYSGNASYACFYDMTITAVRIYTEEGE